MSFVDYEPQAGNATITFDIKIKLLLRVIIAKLN